MKSVSAIKMPPIPGNIADLLTKEPETLLKGMGEDPKRMRGISTGFPELDNCIDGLGGLIGISGMPGAGKSTFVANIALNVAGNGENVVYISAEMGLSGGFAYLLAAAKGGEDNAPTVREIMRGGRKLVNNPDYLPRSFQHIRIADRGALDGDKAQTLGAVGAGADLLVVDSLHGLPYGTDEEMQAVKAWIEALRAWSDSTGAPVLIIMQGAKKDGGEDGVFAGRGAAALGYEVDVMMNLYIEKDTGTRTKGENVVTLEVSKNRRGWNKKIDFEYFRATSQFNESEENL